MRVSCRAFSSTGSVYGEATVFPTPEDAPFPVQTSLYASSKVAAEGLLSSYALGYALRRPQTVPVVVVVDYQARHVGLPASFVELTLATTWRGVPMSERLSRAAQDDVPRRVCRLAFRPEFAALLVDDAHNRTLYHAAHGAWLL